MRFLYYDRIEDIEPQRRIIGSKAFALSEEFFRRHFSKEPLVPGVIYIEAMAQLLGWLIIYSYDFRLSAVMTLLEGVKIEPALRPGFKAEIHGELLNSSLRDSLGRAWIIVEGKEIARIERIIYTHFRDVDSKMLKEWFHYYCGLNP
jgi:3-hydroxyacyl-[acyl-carrier-protein] dehydratase